MGEKRTIRRKASAEKEWELIRSALLLRGKAPAETLETMFDLIASMEEINRVANEA